MVSEIDRNQFERVQVCAQTTSCAIGWSSLSDAACNH
jgi:hypothetical protein